MLTFAGKMPKNTLEHISRCSFRAKLIKPLVASATTESKNCIYALLTDIATKLYDGCGECSGFQCAFCWRGVAAILKNMDDGYNRYLADEEKAGNAFVDIIINTGNHLLDCVKEGKLDGDTIGYKPNDMPQVRRLQL